jgi:hypothetical protein
MPAVRSDDLLLPEFGAGCEPHFFFKSAGQLRTRVLGAGFSSLFAWTRKRLLSAATSYEPASLCGFWGNIDVKQRMHAFHAEFILFGFDLGSYEGIVLGDEKTRAIHLAHPARAQRGDDLVGTQFCSRRQHHSWPRL